jgi:hypothetical protein
MLFAVTLVNICDLRVNPGSHQTHLQAAGLPMTVAHHLC